MAHPIRRECCDHCLWNGPVNKDGTVRKHFVSDKPYGKRVQIPSLGTCPGSNKPPAKFGADGEYGSTTCGVWTGERAACTLPKGHRFDHCST